MERSILDWSIRALLMAAGTWLVVIALRLRAPSALHRVWTGAMAAMLLLPAWTNWGPSVVAPLLPPASARPDVGAAAPAEMPSSIEAPPATVRGPVRSAPWIAMPDWSQALFALYLAGFAAMLARLMGGTLVVRSMGKQTRKAEGFVTSPLCSAPVTIGWLRPAPVLPETWRTWSAAKLDAVLIHEREHVRRRDPLVQWLALLNRCVFWFHPLAWWLERKLAALAEEACDAAVLAAGHAAPDYARYLIEMAHSVRASSTRIRPAGALSFLDGRLPGRIRRILDAAPAPPVSAGKSIASAVFCAIPLAAFLACRVGPSPPVASQPSMHEQERQMKAALFIRQPKMADASLWFAVRKLTPGGAAQLDADVRANPDDWNKLLQLVRYYQFQNDLKSLNGLTLWYIGEHPDLRLGWGYHPAWNKVWDEEGFRQGSQLWAEQMKKPWTSPFVYMNAAEFLSGNDNTRAEQLLLEGQRRFPSSGLHWEVLLARHYAWAITGRPGQLPEDQLVAMNDAAGSPPAHGGYAERVRGMLLASNDAELLSRVVEQFQHNRANLGFTRACIDRVLLLQPDNGRIHRQREALRRFEVELRVTADPASLSDSDRMVTLESQLQRSGTNDAGGKANELLALASRNPKDPEYGTALFLADMALGEAALRQGDKEEAAGRLLAAAGAPPTEFLRYEQIDMAFPRKLVDAGGRSAVATFLERCAKFNRGGKPLAEWAAEIRKGINPNLTPDSAVFRQNR